MEKRGEFSSKQASKQASKFQVTAPFSDVHFIRLMINSRRIHGTGSICSRGCNDCIFSSGKVKTAYREFVPGRYKFCSSLEPDILDSRQKRSGMEEIMDRKYAWTGSRRRSWEPAGGRSSRAIRAGRSRRSGKNRSIRTGRSRTGRKRTADGRRFGTNRTGFGG